MFFNITLIPPKTQEVKDQLEVAHRERGELNRSTKYERIEVPTRAPKWLEVACRESGESYIEWIVTESRTKVPRGASKCKEEHQVPTRAPKCHDLFFLGIGSIFFKKKKEIEKILYKCIFEKRRETDFF